MKKILAIIIFQLCIINAISDPIHPIPSLPKELTEAQNLRIREELDIKLELLKDNTNSDLYAELVHSDEFNKRMKMLMLACLADYLVGNSYATEAQYTPDQPVLQEDLRHCHKCGLQETNENNRIVYVHTYCLNDLMEKENKATVNIAATEPTEDDSITITPLSILWIIIVIVVIIAGSYCLYKIFENAFRW